MATGMAQLHMQACCSALPGVWSFLRVTHASHDISDTKHCLLSRPASITITIWWHLSFLFTRTLCITARSPWNTSDWICACGTSTNQNCRFNDGMWRREPATPAWGVPKHAYRQHVLKYSYHRFVATVQTWTHSTRLHIASLYLARSSPCRLHRCWHSIHIMQPSVQSTAPAQRPAHRPRLAAANVCISWCLHPLTVLWAHHSGAARLPLNTNHACENFCPTLIAKLFPALPGSTAGPGPEPAQPPFVSQALSAASPSSALKLGPLPTTRTCPSDVTAQLGRWYPVVPAERS